MKKSFLIIATFATSLVANAQVNNTLSLPVDKDILVMIGMITAIALIAFTVLFIIKQWMAYRLKNKFIDKQISEEVINSILKNGENRNTNIKWFIILLGLGVALTIINYTLPLGIHSLAIMSFSISASFLIYFFFLKHIERQK